jgi:hypothetical protein
MYNLLNDLERHPHFLSSLPGFDPAIHAATLKIQTDPMYNGHLIMDPRIKSGGDENIRGKALNTA